MKPAMRQPMKADIDALETRMGELASLLSEMADALTSYPEAIHIVNTAAEAAAGDGSAQLTLQSGEWPTIQELEQLLANWRQLRVIVDRG